MKIYFRLFSVLVIFTLCSLFAIDKWLVPIKAPSANVETIYTASSIYKEKLGSVVQVLAKENAFSRQTYGGTGFFIDDKGTIITAAHVIYLENNDAVAGAVRVMILGDKTLYRAEVLKVDLEHDIAILRILQFDTFVKNAGYVIDSDKALDFNKKFEYLKIDPNYVPTAGDEVFTLGYPENFEDVITVGIVISEKLVDISMSKDDAQYNGLILSSLNLGSGNSGGPVFNNKGYVVGVATIGSGGPLSLFQHAKYIQRLLDDTSDKIIVYEATPSKLNVIFEDAEGRVCVP